MGWKHYQTVDQPKREPQVGSGLFGIRLLILHYKFQFSKSIKSSTFHISLRQFNLPFEKKYLFPKMPKNHPNIYTKPPNRRNVMSREIQRCLKRDRRDIGRKAVLSHVKTASTCTPALNQKIRLHIPYINTYIIPFVFRKYIRWYPMSKYY